MLTRHRITACLWFSSEAGEAASFYAGIFPHSRITRVTYYGEAGRDIHGQSPGTVLTVAFELDGQPFTALNGGPLFRFNEAISLQVDCASQEEADYYWDRLCAGGDPAARQCGWLKDKYGLSWQVVPRVLVEMIADPDRSRADRVMQALLGMQKLEIAALEEAYGS